MKHVAAFSIALALAAAHGARADDVDIRSFDYLDVVETSDGSVWKGVVVEQTPGVQYKLVTSDGSVHVLRASDVVKLSKQHNPWRTSVATAPVGATAARDDAALESREEPGDLPAPYATSGVRADIDLAFIFPSGDIGGLLTSFAPDVHVGYEQLYGHLGLTAGGQARWTVWRTPDVLRGATAWTLETHAYARASLHVGRASPYLGLSLGTDVTYVDAPAPINETSTGVGFGMNLGFGLPVALAPGVAGEIGGEFHPGTDEFAESGSAQFFALRVGAMARF